jgi:hypothetical protein
MRSLVTSRFRPATAVFLSTLALGVMACGDSDDDAAEPSASTPTTAEEQRDQGSPAEADAEKTAPADEGAPKPAPSEKEAAPSGGSDAPESSGADETTLVASAVTNMYAAFAEGDARGVCGVMSSSARQEAATGTPAPDGAGKPTTCVGALSTFFAAAAETGALNDTIRATVDDVAIDGGTAIATVTINGRKGEVRLVKESGEWRFGKLPSGGG